MKTALHAEWTKVRTSPGTKWLLLAIVAATLAVSELAVSTTDNPELSLTGVQLGQAVVAILAVLAIGTEYSTGLIGVTFAAMPGRTGVLAAKLAILTVLVAVSASVAVLGCALIGDVGSFRPSGGSVLYLVLIGVLALGVATAVRNSAVAIGVVLGLLYVLPVIALAVSDPKWERRLQRLSPMTAGLAIQNTAPQEQPLIGPWAGLGVLAAWAGGALILGILLLERRDA